VPTVNGNLSFRHIGEASHPTRSVYANVSTAQRRIIVAFQKRPLSDVLYKTIIHRLRGIEGDFYFILAAVSNGPLGASSKITGSVFIFKSKADWKAGGKDLCRRSIGQLNMLRLRRDSNRDGEIQSCYDTLINIMRTSSDICIPVSLERTGFVYFGEPKFTEIDLQSASEAYVGTELGYDLNRSISDQSYFFLRDLSHVHQHHGKTSDTILVLQDRRDVSDDELRKNIVYSLQHHVIRAKRIDDSFSLARAMGVMAYCRSFISICGTTNPKSAGLPLYNDDSAIRSIEAKLHEISALEVSRTRRATTGTGLLAIAAIIITAFAIFVQPLVTDEGFPRLRAIAGELANNLLLLLIIFTVILIVGCVKVLPSIKKPNGMWSYYYYEFLLDSLELANARRWWSVLIITLAFLFLASVTVYFGMPAFADLKARFPEIVRLFSFFSFF